MKNLISAAALTFLTVIAYGQNTNIKKVNATTYSVGINNETFRFERVNTVDAGRGGAACIMMVLNYEGLNVSQDQIARSSRSQGTIPSPRVNDNPKQDGLENLMFDMNRTSPADWSSGKQWKIYTEADNVDPKLIFDELSADRPLITSFRISKGDRNTVIISDMSYLAKLNDKGEQTGMVPLTVTLRDPSMSSLATRMVNWDDFINKATTLYTVKVVPKNADQKKEAKAK